jgi:hypothetical protein
VRMSFGMKSTKKAHGNDRRRESNGTLTVSESRW